MVGITFQDLKYMVEAVSTGDECKPVIRIPQLVNCGIDQGFAHRGKWIVGETIKGRTYFNQKKKKKKKTVQKKRVGKSWIRSTGSEAREFFWGPIPNFMILNPNSDFFLLQARNR